MQDDDDKNSIGGDIPGADADARDNGSVGVTDCATDINDIGSVPFDCISNDTPADVDSRGVTFDAAVHAAKDGKPIITAGGTFRYKPGCKPVAKDAAPIFGAAPASEPPSAHLSSGNVTPAPTAPIKAVSKVNPGDLAEISAGIFITLGETIGGEGFKPDNEAEKSNLCRAFKNYYESLNLSKFSPASVLCLALGAYSFKKAAKPEVREKGIGFFRKWFYKLTGKKPETTAAE